MNPKSLTGTDTKLSIVVRFLFFFFIMIVVDPQGTRDLSRDEIVSGKTILYVYPKDNTPGCTVQAVDFSQAKETLTAMGVSLYGVSLDSEKSHASFIAKHDLTIPLVVDTDKELIGTDRLP